MKRILTPGKWRQHCTAVIAGFLLILLPGAARATILTMEADIEFSGGTAPAGPAPWFTVTIDDHGSTGSVTFDLTGAHLTSTENISELDLNLDPALSADLGSLTFTELSRTGSFTTPTIFQGEDNFRANSGGLYDIRLSFAVGTNHTFIGGDAIQYSIAGAGLTASSFDFLSTPAGGHGPFVMAAHIQNTPAGGGSSGWVTDSVNSHVQAVPEPSTACLAGFGLISLATIACGRRATLGWLA
ncbi:MAG: PEP-CTERM sorting domain-containing protein [Planctomycetia bacterium]|nr:PEP-CTERM sorting domain-containing protein [Planctomycetia bacterium]